MADAILLSSPLPYADRSDERLPEEVGSIKLLEEGDGEKLPAETPTGKLIMPCTGRVLPSFLVL